MGNNPSRAATQHQQQHQQSTHSSASTSPPNAPARTTSSSASRKPGYRRNSLQSPASVKYNTPSSQEFSTTKHRHQKEQPHESVTGDFLPSSDHQHRYHTPPSGRESIAETISESGYKAFLARTREELLQDAATLRIFPSPPTSQDKALSTATAMSSSNVPPSPFAPGVNPFGRVGPNRYPAAPSEGMRQWRGSMESTTASMEEDMAPESDARAIPTLIQWPYSGIKVYITGTFCAWEKRYRLARNPADGIMSAVVDLPPGTHHVKFLVDGEMRTSPDLPTAVDDTGILVNYLEVSVDEMPPLSRQFSTHSSAGNPRDSTLSERIPPNVPAESQLHYTTEIPAYLKDFAENYNDEDMRGPGHSADGAPPPPSLPMMLQKVILNTSNQMKDDASVLSIPNHAVLNHLATSSIKNSILAVSATTRYKKKYVTTILYKAASAQED